MTEQDPVLAVITACGRKAQRTEGGFKVLCPCHADKNPSLKVATGTRQWKVDLHCFAGCNVRDIRDRFIQLGVPADYLGRRDATPNSNGRRVDRTYAYCDEDGKILFETVRYTPKDFRQRRPDGNGGHVYDLRGVRRVLYRLPEVLEARKQPRWIVVVEGEKDADRLARDGIVATCSPMGAGKWRNEYAKFLAGAKIAILPDNDEPGRTHAEQIARSLRGVAATVKLIDLPGLGDKSDVFDWLEQGHTAAELKERIEAADEWGGVSPADDGTAAPITPATAATVPPVPSKPVEPPSIAYAARILDEFKKAVRTHGVVGEDATACATYLAVTSRLLEKPVSLAIKGHSASGKSHTVQTTLKFFPPEARIEMTGMSERALIYTEKDLRHRTIVLYEAEGLRDSREDNQTAYYVRSLLSEGHLAYDVVVQDKKNGGFTTKEYRKEGPTNLIFTTTRTQVHAENETRVLSLTTNDSTTQTRDVFRVLANEGRTGVGLDEWCELQRWLEGATHEVTIPYGPELAEVVEPAAVRLRRDFGAVLSFIRAHAVLHQATRDRDAAGRIIATPDDYGVVRDLVKDTLAESVGTSVSETVRETVDAIAELTPQHREGVTAQALAQKLGLDKSAARRRLIAAKDGDYVRNLEERRGQPGRWVIGEPLPDKQDVLPPPVDLRVAGGTDLATAESLVLQGDQAPGGTVARRGESKAPPPEGEKERPDGAGDGSQAASDPEPDPENPDEPDIAEQLLACALGARVIDDGAVSGWTARDAGGQAAPVAEQLTTGGTAPDVDHPARYSRELLPVIGRPLADWRMRVHDPFAGTGERLGRLCDELGLTFSGTEIEPEWIVDHRVREGDSTDPSAYPDGEYVVATSPTYPNGMADHFKARDYKKRNTYRQALQRTQGGIDRELHPNNTGRYNIRRGDQIEAQYWRLVRKAVAHWPDHAVVNVKDFYYENTRIYPLVAKWIDVLHDYGYEIVSRDDVKTPGQRQGANRQRVETEAVLVCERARRDSSTLNSEAHSALGGTVDQGGDGQRPRRVETDCDRDGGTPCPSAEDVHS